MVRVHADCREKENLRYVHPRLGRHGNIKVYIGDTPPRDRGALCSASDEQYFLSKNLIEMHVPGALLTWKTKTHNSCNHTMVVSYEIPEER